MHNQIQVGMKKDYSKGHDDFPETEGDVQQELDPAEEFAAILYSALNPKLPQERHFVYRANLMALNDPENFYTLAAQTIVACTRKIVNDNEKDKNKKYHKIGVHLSKANQAVDCGSSEQLQVLEKLKKIVDRAIVIF